MLGWSRWRGAIHCPVHIREIHTRIHPQFRCELCCQVRYQVRPFVSAVNHDSLLVIISESHHITETLRTSYSLHICIDHLAPAKSILPPVCTIIVIRVQTILQWMYHARRTPVTIPPKLVVDTVSIVIHILVRSRDVILPCRPIVIIILDIPPEFKFQPPLHASARLLGIFHQLWNRVGSICRKLGLTDLSLLRCNKNHPIARTATVNRCRRRIFQHLYRFNHARVQVSQRIRTGHRWNKRIHRHSIHHPQRLSVTRTIHQQRVEPPHRNHRSTTRSSRLRHNIHTRQSSLQHVCDARCRQFFHFFRCHRRDCTHHLPLILRTVSPDNHFIQIGYIFRQGNTQRISRRLFRKFHPPFLKTDRWKFQRPFQQRQIPCEPTFLICSRTNSSADNPYRYPRQRLFGRIIYEASHPNKLLLGFLVRGCLYNYQIIVKRKRHSQARQQVFEHRL